MAEMAGPQTVKEGQAMPRRMVSGSKMEAFYQEFFLPLVRRAARRHGLSTEDARDVVQEAFVVALVKMESEGNAGAWLKQVVDFLAVNFRRTAARRAVLMATWMPGVEPDGSVSIEEI